MERSARLGMRVKPEDKAVWERQAMVEGFKSVSAWIEHILNQRVNAFKVERAIAAEGLREYDGSKP
jgi:predicted HicB family RNase H-like nuclease